MARCCTRARLVARHKVPLLGVNRGRLGFLTDVMPQDMLQSVDAALTGSLEHDERPLLAARLHRPGGAVAQRVRAQRRRHAEARDRAHARLRDAHRRTLRQHARRRWHHRRQPHRLDRLCALLRRSDHRAAPAGAGDRADLRAHALRPPDRGGRAARSSRWCCSSGPTPARTSPATARCSVRSPPASVSRSPPAAERVTLLHPPATTTTGCCAPSSTGAAAASER